MIKEFEPHSSMSDYLYPGDVIAAVNGQPIGYIGSNQQSLGQLLRDIPINSKVDLSVLVKNYNYALATIPAITDTISQQTDHIRQSVQVLNIDATSELAEAIIELIKAIASLVIGVIELVEATIEAAATEVLTFGASTLALAAPLAEFAFDLIELAKAVDNLIATVENIAAADVQRYIVNSSQSKQGVVVNKEVDKGASGLIRNNLYLGNGITDKTTSSILIPTSFFQYTNEIYFTVSPGSYNTKLVAGVVGVAGKFRPFLGFDYWIYTQNGKQLFGASGSLHRPPSHGFTVHETTTCRVQVEKTATLGVGVRVIAFFIVRTGN